jgi:hypothetical protein
MGKQPAIVIAFAYGASDWRTTEVRPAYEANLPGIDVTFEAVDWRPFLPSPQAHLMRFVRNREGASAETSKASKTPRSSPSSRATAQFPARADLAETAAERQAIATGRQAGRVSLDPLTRPAMRVVHHAMVDHAGITMADVLGYLRDPEAVIDPVCDRLLEIRRGAGERPVVAVGLSLGGIILVDSLARLLGDTKRPETDRSPADLLVTVGSQSAALRAMGVMPSAPRDVIHPRLFTPWLNVWHEHDYLSYPVGAMFEHLGDVSDRRAVQRGAFPGVHSGYLNRSSRFFDHLAEAIRERF